MPPIINLIDSDSESELVENGSTSPSSSSGMLLVKGSSVVGGQKLLLTPATDLSVAEESTRDESPLSPLAKFRKDGTTSQHDDTALQTPQHVSVPRHLLPMSRYTDWQPPSAPMDERRALTLLFSGNNNQDDGQGFNDVLLDDFSIYRGATNTRFPWQLVSLDAIISGREAPSYFLDGMIRYGGISAYIQRVEIHPSSISIDGLATPDIYTSQNQVFVQTRFGWARKHKAQDTWYRLGSPSRQYRPLHQGFLWVVDLVKHVIDYIDHRFGADHQKSIVRLKDFASDFSSQLRIWHMKDKVFLDWFRLHGRDDFRCALNRHKRFLFNRIDHLQESTTQFNLDVLEADLMVKPVNPKLSPENTTVTAYVNYCCREMSWSPFMSVKEISPKVVQDRAKQVLSGGFSKTFRQPFHPTTLQNRPNAAEILRQAVHRPVKTRYSAQEVKNRCVIVRYDSRPEFVFVQDVGSRRYKTELAVLFLFPSSETICSKGIYPWPNELFLTDICCCNAEGPTLKDVIAVVDIKFHQTGPLPSGLFFRQKYLADDESIVKATPLDLNCACRRPTIASNCIQLGGPKAALPGISLFCGLGNFDHGLEAAGGIDIVAGIDINEAPLRTYAQNRAAGARGLVHGSVNPHLDQLLSGNETRLPRVGTIEFLCAGSPCQGFSLANRNRGDEKAERNCSLVASTLSYIDTYLPKYVALENVTSIGISGDQIIACLAGLGYQIRKLAKIDSAEYGSVQSRARYYLLAAAPGVELPAAPRKLFLDHENSGAVCLSKGLPSVQNDDLICIPFPDHVPGARQTPHFRRMIENIPCYPYGLGVAQSVAMGRQGRFIKEWHRKKIRSEKSEYAKHRSYTRLDPTAPIPTLTTSCQPADGRGGGRILHWNDQRTLTVQEARRAQGIPDDEVIIGSVATQWAQVGNAVNRHVAKALGKVIQQAWMASPTGSSVSMTTASTAKTSTTKNLLTTTTVSTTATISTTTTTSISIELPSTPQNPPSHAILSSDSSASPLSARQFQKSILPIIGNRPSTPDRPTPAKKFMQASPSQTTHLKEIFAFQNGPSPHAALPAGASRRRKRVIEDSDEDDDDDEDRVTAWTPRRVRRRIEEFSSPPPTISKWSMRKPGEIIVIDDD